MSASANWREEKQSAWLYRHMVEAEQDVITRGLFAALADAAESQARIWAGELRKQGQPVPDFRPGSRAHTVAALISWLGPKRIRPVLAAMKVRGISVYSGLPLSVGHPMPMRADETEYRHRGVAGGGNLRAAVFGVNDGLVSNTSLIMGVAGATADTRLILTSGVAGLLAGALSMAAGEYISVRSQREMYEYQIGLEREELAEYPEEEAEELALVYHARGMAIQEARRVAGQMIQEPEQALDALAREELGLNPQDLGSPWRAAAFSFVAFTSGAMVPLLPFLIGATGAVPAAAVLAAVGLFAVGAAISLFTGRTAWRNGLRMVLIGGGAGILTYSIGTVLGTALP